MNNINPALNGFTPTPEQQMAIQKAADPIIALAVEQGPAHQRNLMGTLLRRSTFEVVPVWEVPVMGNPTAFIPQNGRHPEAFVVFDSSQEPMTDQFPIFGVIVGGFTWEAAGLG